jgi:hypothetical protein
MYNSGHITILVAGLTVTVVAVAAGPAKIVLHLLSTPCRRPQAARIPLGIQAVSAILTKERDTCDKTYDGPTRALVLILLLRPAHYAFLAWLLQLPLCTRRLTVIPR